MVLNRKFSIEEMQIARKSFKIMFLKWNEGSNKGGNRKINT